MLILNKKRIIRYSFLLSGETQICLLMEWLRVFLILRICSFFICRTPARIKLESKDDHSFFLFFLCIFFSNLVDTKDY